MNYEEIWKKIIKRNKDKIEVYIKEGDKEIIKGKNCFAVKCKAKDLR